MSTITDLRETLGRHAEDVVDTGLTGRAGAVHHQVRVVRRRRAATAVTAAVVAIGGTVAVVGLGDGPGVTPLPASELGGHAVPQHLTSLGYSYAYDGGVTGAAMATLRLEASDQPRLVSWASSDGVVKIAGPQRQVWTSDATHFDDFTLVPAGDRATYTAYGQDAALAVYDLTDAAPEGVTRDGITFRQQVAGQQLLGAAIADSGAARASADIDVAEAGRLTISYFCSGGSADMWTHVQVDGEPAYGFEGCTDPAFDPGGPQGLSIGRTVSPGQDGVFRVWATEGEDGPVVDDPDVRVGVGVYGAPESTTEAARMPAPALVESDGHTWQLLDVREAAPGQRELMLEPSDRDVFVKAFVTGVPGTTSVEVLRDHRVVYRFPGGDGVSGSLGVLRVGASPLTLRLDGEAGPGARMALALYSQLG